MHMPKSLFVQLPIPFKKSRSVFSPKKPSDTATQECRLPSVSMPNSLQHACIRISVKLLRV